ncbi:MAG: response regulator [Gammaproteobacteria bacterium]
MRVLAIDDDPPTLELVSSVLTTNGIACLTASSGEQALALIAAHPDILLAISDINMPAMDGIALLGRINAQSAPGSAPRVIFLTAHARVDYAVAALRLGAIDFLTKPVRPQNLLGVVRNAWDDALRARAASALPDEVAALARKAQELAAIVQRRAVPRLPESALLPAQNAVAPAERGAGHSADAALLGMDRLRRLRREFPPLGELDDVSWDLVRELVRVERTTQRLSVSALSMAAEEVSSSTAVRRIQDLVRTGVLVRTPDPADARRDFVNLAPEMRATLDRYLAQVAQEFAALASGST